MADALILLISLYLAIFLHDHRSNYPNAMNSHMADDVLSALGEGNTIFHIIYEVGTLRLLT